MNDSHEARRAIVRHLIRTKRIGTQEGLRKELLKRGVDVTQATLSRDLAQLEARRVAHPEGGTTYELPDERATTPEDELAEMADMVVDVDHNGTLVVVTTITGAASAVCAVVDRARLTTVLGTIAGDDTIFIAPARRASAQSVTKQLKDVWRKGT